MKMKETLQLGKQNSLCGNLPNREGEWQKNGKKIESTKKTRVERRKT